MHSVIEDNFGIIEATQSSCSFTQHHLCVRCYLMYWEHSCIAWLWVQILSSLFLHL